MDPGESWKDVTSTRLVNEDMSEDADHLTITHKPNRSDPLLGKTIAGKFEVLSLIGEGGMSVVYCARHLLLNKLVAVKVLRSHLAQTEHSVKRFRQEARAASSLSHQGIVAIHDFGAGEDGNLYLVMDYVDGRSLADIIKESGPLPLSQFIDVFSEVCDALAHAHAGGVIHRDLKPSNIMLVTGFDGKLHIKIVDFGIAKIMPGENSELASLTQTGETFGSPLYMSPEQCVAQQLTLQSDIYSIGCVMYEALTGTPPFVGGNVYETIHMQMNEAPRSFAGSIQNRALGDALEALVFRAMAKEAADRFPSMAAMKLEILELESISHNSLVARLAFKSKLMWTRLRSSMNKKRRQWVLGSALTITAVVVAGAVVRELETFKFAMTAAKQINDQLIMDKFPDEVRSGADGRQRTADDMAKAAQAKALLELELRMKMKDDDPRLYQDYLNVGEEFRASGGYEEALKSFKQAYACTRNEHSAFTLHRVVALEGIASCDYYQNRIAEAAQCFKSTLDEIDSLQTLGEKSTSLIPVHARMADCYYLMRDYKRAYREYERAIRVCDIKKDERSVLAALIALKASDVYRRLAESNTDAELAATRIPARKALLAKAAAGYKFAQQIFEASRGEQKNNEIYALAGLADTLYLQGDAKGAETTYHEAISEANSPGASPGAKQRAEAAYFAFLCNQQRYVDAIGLAERLGH